MITVIALSKDHPIQFQTYLNGAFLHATNGTEKFMDFTRVWLYSEHLVVINSGYKIYTITVSSLKRTHSRKRMSKRTG